MEEMKTGMIMDVITDTPDMQKKTESMQAAVDNDQVEKLKVLAQRYKDAHTQKVRKFDKVGRNDPCPCGSQLKYKQCCLNSGKFEGYKFIEK